MGDNDSKNISISPTVRSALNGFRTAVKNFPRKSKAYKYSRVENDSYHNTGSAPLPPDKRLIAAAKKLNGNNELTMTVVTNYCADPKNDCNLLQEYKAYRNPKLDGLELTPVSEDTVSALYRGKPVEIKRSNLDDGSKQFEINFDDGSNINYVIFAEGSKMDINGEEFEMPEGTILEVKSIPGKVFSQLIQTPDMGRNVVNMPDIIEKTDQILNTNNKSEKVES